MCKETLKERHSFRIYAKLRIFSAACFNERYKSKSLTGMGLRDSSDFKIKLKNQIIKMHLQTDLRMHFFDIFK